MKNKDIKNRLELATHIWHNKWHKTLYVFSKNWVATMTVKKINDVVEATYICNFNEQFYE
jgi:hypothetical protein